MRACGIKNVTELIVNLTLHIAIEMKNSANLTKPEFPNENTQYCEALSHKPIGYN